MCCIGGKGCFRFLVSATAITFSVGCLSLLFGVGASTVIAVATAHCLCSSVAFPWAWYLVASRRCGTEYKKKLALALLNCCQGALCLLSAACLYCSTTSPIGCLPSCLRGSGAGYFAALHVFGQNDLTLNASNFAYALLLIGQVLFVLNVFSGGLALLKGLSQIRDCLAASIGNLDCVHNLAFLSGSLFQTLPTLSAFSILFNLVCFRGCLCPDLQEPGARLTSYAVESRRPASANPLVSTWDSSDMPLLCSLVAFTLCLLRAAGCQSLKSCFQRACSLHSRFHSLLLWALMIALAIDGYFLQDGSDMPSVLAEVDLVLPPLHTWPVPNTSFYIHVASTALLLTGAFACSRSILVCELLALLCYAIMWLFLQANFHDGAFKTLDWTKHRGHGPHKLRLLHTPRPPARLLLCFLPSRGKRSHSLHLLLSIQRSTYCMSGITSKR